MTATAAASLQATHMLMLLDADWAGHMSPAIMAWHGLGVAAESGWPRVRALFHRGGRQGHKRSHNTKMQESAACIMNLLMSVVILQGMMASLGSSMMYPV